jgi:hypothetical protein
MTITIIRTFIIDITTDDPFTSGATGISLHRLLTNPAFLLGCGQVKEKARPEEDKERFSCIGEYAKL